MKLKEYPKSFFYALKLAFTPLTKLGRSAQKTDIPIIVTFTSIPSRLGVLSTTVRSLLNQTVQPEKIILWLYVDLESQIPSALKKLQSDKFVIRYKEGTSSHRKLVFALKEYPNHVLVTCDDDLIYPPDWLERLLADHKLYPSDIIAHECRNIAYDQNGKLLPYKHWKTAQPGESTTNTLAIGYGGTLYPAYALHKDTTNRALFMELTPKADDLWFKAMALQQNTQVRRSQHPNPKPIPIARSQKIALGHTNIKQDGNRSQWQAILDYYQLNLAHSSKEK